ncbi:MAG: hypothetical protein JSS99_14105 [Actinobacteria bacterium]|nr:hypothetical protein [Actinomycetota bacterium]
MAAPDPRRAAVLDALRTHPGIGFVLVRSAAFEELVGSHGGLGGGQSHPFVLHPVALPWPAEEVVGAEAVHRVLRGWLAQVGQAGYASTSSDAPTASVATRTPGAARAT